MAGSNPSPSSKAPSPSSEPREEVDGLAREASLRTRLEKEKRDREAAAAWANPDPWDAMVARSSGRLPSPPLPPPPPPSSPRPPVGPGGGAGGGRGGQGFRGGFRAGSGGFRPSGGFHNPGSSSSQNYSNKRKFENQDGPIGSGGGAGILPVPPNSSTSRSGQNQLICFACHHPN